MALHVSQPYAKVIEVSWDPSSIDTLSMVTDTITVRGITTDQEVVLNVPALTAGLAVLQYWVSATNTISIIFYNSTGGTVNNAAVTVKVIVL